MAAISMMRCAEARSREEERVAEFLYLERVVVYNCIELRSCVNKRIEFKYVYACRV